MVAVPLKEGMRPHMDDTVQVAAAAAGIAGLALAAAADGGAVIDAGRDRDFQAAVGQDAAVAAAGRAGIGDDLAAAATGATGLLNPEEPLALDDDALAMAAPARGRARAVAGAAPRAFTAELLATNAHGLDDAARCLGQVELDLDAVIPAPCRTVPRIVAEQPAQNVAEQVAEHRPGVVEVRHVHAVEAGMAVAVIALPLLGVAEHVVGLGRLLEFQVRLRVADIAIGMILHGQLAVGALDLLVVRVARHAEHFVIVSFGAGHHGSLLTQESVRKWDRTFHSRRNFLGVL